MKKIFAFLVIFSSFLFTSSFAEVYVVSSGVQYQEDTVEKSYQHNGLGPNSSCTYCDGNHWADGKFYQTPVCDCPAVQTVPAGAIEKTRWTVTRDHSCNNDKGYQQTTVHHAIEYVETEDAPKTNICQHNLVCSSHGASPSEHGIGRLADYEWQGQKYDGKCSNCGNPLYIGKCGRKSLLSSPSPSPTSSSGSSSTPDDEEEHCEHDWREESHSCSAPSDINYNPPDTSNQRFASFIDNTEYNRRKNPYNVGSEFSVWANQHYETRVSVSGEITKYWQCGAVLYDVCRNCGATRQRGTCYNNGSYTDYTNATWHVEYKNYDVIFEFEGFGVDKKYNVTNSMHSLPSEDVKRKDVDKYNRELNNQNKKYQKGGTYSISGIDEDRLKEDDGKYGDVSSGMRKSTERISKENGTLYGLVKVSCSCRCTSDRYRIYFNFTPPIEEEEYTLTLKAEGAPFTGGVKIIGTGDETYKEMTQTTKLVGTKISILAQANDGYEFDGWYNADGDKYSEKGNADSGNGFSLFMPGYDLTLIAKFKPKIRYNVEVYSDGNGDIKFDGKYDNGQEGVNICARVVEGDDVKIIAKPNENYSIDFWELIKEAPGENQNIGDENELVVSNVQENYKIFVHFKTDIGEYSRLVIDSNGPGYTIGGTDYARAGKYYPIWAVPIGDSEFLYWKEEANNTITDYGRFDTVRMPEGDYYLTAYFVVNDEMYHDVTVKGDGNGNISIDGEEPRREDSTTVISGTGITINAYPDDGFLFDKWTDEYGNIVPGGPELMVTINEDKIYIAHFKYTGEGYKLEVKSAGGGKVSGNVENAVSGKWYPIEAKPYNNYEFLYWANENTGEITDYADYDYVMIQDEDITLVAHFREVIIEEEKYKLTLKTKGSGTVNGGGWYAPEADICICANAGAGYEFVGWFEDNLLISKKADTPEIKMPYYNMTLTAVFERAGVEDKNSPFKILSIRDVRWKDYFTANKSATNNALFVPNAAGKDDVLVNKAELIDSEYESNRNIVYGYAVEFELVTTGLSKDKSHLLVVPKLYEITSSGRINDINIDLGNYSRIKSSDIDDVKNFMITADERSISMPNGYTAPQVTYGWVWYLPIDKYEEILNKISYGSNIIINFDIGIVTESGKKYDYINVVNEVVGCNWGGNVFTYRMDKTLLEDIYNNANN